MLQLLILCPTPTASQNVRKAPELNTKSKRTTTKLVDK